MVYVWLERNPKSQKVGGIDTRGDPEGNLIDFLELIVIQVIPLVQLIRLRPLALLVWKTILL